MRGNILVKRNRLEGPFSLTCIEMLTKPINKPFINLNESKINKCIPFEKKVFFMSCYVTIKLIENLPLFQIANIYVHYTVIFPKNVD